MANFFELAKDDHTGLLPFRRFVSWDYVQAELWYGENNGLTKERLIELWSQYTGSVDNAINFDDFEKLYDQVCNSARM
jgi:hypothetical protein